jgi:hypothetical protein
MERLIKPVMIVSGLLTCTMVYAAISPRAMLQSTYGETLEGPLADVIVRNWGVLIFMVGGMLIYGAFNAGARSMALVVGGASKVVYIGLVLAHGSRFLSPQAITTIAVDAAMVVIFAAYLTLGRKTA